MLYGVGECTQTIAYALVGLLDGSVVSASCYLQLPPSEGEPCVHLLLENVEDDRSSPVWEVNTLTKLPTCAPSFTLLVSEGKSAVMKCGLPRAGGLRDR